MPMKLNHLDLHVPDIAATADFLIEYFGLRLVEMRGANGLAILTDDDGLELVVSHAIEKFGSADQSVSKTVSYHIGFIVTDRAEVDAIYQRLKTSKAELWGEPREMRGGWAFYCLIPGHILVEVGARALHV